MEIDDLHDNGTNKQAKKKCAPRQRSGLGDLAQRRKKKATSSTTTTASQGNGAVPKEIEDDTGFIRCSLVRARNLLSHRTRSEQATSLSVLRSDLFHLSFQVHPESYTDSDENRLIDQLEFERLRKEGRISQQSSIVNSQASPEADRIVKHYENEQAQQASAGLRKRRLGTVDSLRSATVETPAPEVRKGRESGKHSRGFGCLPRRYGGCFVPHSGSRGFGAFSWYLYSFWVRELDCDRYDLPTGLIVRRDFQAPATWIASLPLGSSRGSYVSPMIHPGSVEELVQRLAVLERAMADLSALDADDRLRVEAEQRVNSRTSMRVSSLESRTACRRLRTNRIKSAGK
jgi:hypothetical protein